MTLYHSTGIIAASGGAAAKPGMVLLKPTSIAHSGTSASIGANGQVTFTAVTSLSLNGVFQAGYDNYMVSIRYNDTNSRQLRARMRVGGADNSTASSYVIQWIEAQSTNVQAARQTQNFAYVGLPASTNRSGDTVFFYGPFLAQPTAMRNVNVCAFDGAYILDHASTHNQSTSYDGFTLFQDTGNMTGALTVYGIRS